MRQETAQVLAINVLGWLVGEDGLIDGFMTMTGVSARGLRAQASEPAFLCGVLDYVTQEDARVLDCAAALNEPPEALMQARVVLGRGDLRHWT